jgi:hypothetical protein
MAKRYDAAQRRNARRPYSGYFLTDVPPPDDELTRVGPGTPMGEYMRRFWHPLCLSEELGDLPLASRVLGEDLVAFRDKSGHFGDEYPGGSAEECGVGKIDMLGQAKVDDYEEAQRFPGDWEAQASQRPIAVHALEHLGTTDGGVALIRRALRDALRGKAPRAWPDPSPDGVVEGKPVNLYTEDTVMKIPPTGDYDGEWALMGEVGDKVSDIVFEADKYEGRERIDHIQKKLKDLEASYN